MVTLRHYETREELIAALKKSLNMRYEYEARVRRKYEEMKAAGLIN